MKIPAEYQFDLSGGHLALDFANTVSLRSFPESRREHLNNYSDLVAFARQSKLLSSHEAESLQTYGLANPADAARAFRRAIKLREALYRVFFQAATGKAAASEDIGLVNAAAIDALQHRRLTRVNSGYAWQWDTAAAVRPERILWSIAQSAADLLSSGQLAKVRACEASDCEWLFLDVSRNHSRRWCDMKSCGNRQKARRHYRKERLHN